MYASCLAWSSRRLSSLLKCGVRSAERGIEPEPPTPKMGLEETLALTPALSPRRGGSTHSFRNFHALWCGIASWGLTSAATVHGPNTRAKANDHRLKAVLDAGIVPNSEVSFISRNRRT